jgi:hypothetical protein
MPLRRITYISRADAGITPVDLRQIYGLAEVLHRRLDLSGVLAFTGPHFLQVIEGEPQGIDELMKQIVADTRHSGLKVFCDAPIERRRFDHWEPLMVDSLDLVDEVEAALVDGHGGCERAAYLTNRLLQLRSETKF